jgi:hypothetical protein
MKNPDTSINIEMKYTREGEFFIVEFIGPGFENFPKFYSRKHRLAFSHALRYYADVLKQPLTSSVD